MKKDKDYDEPSWGAEKKSSKKIGLTLFGITAFIVLLALGQQGGNIWAFIALSSVSIFTYFFEKIYRGFKYYIIGNGSYENIEGKLAEIGNKDGIVEITGGAETGKTLVTILFSIYLKGKTGCNVPNTIEGCQLLTLATLKEHGKGNYQAGFFGKNNILIIDECGNFFNKQALQKANLERNLGDLLTFLSETSKTGIKIFFVNKLGAKLPKSFAILTEGKSLKIRTLGVERYVIGNNKDYYYLKLRINNEKILYLPFKEEIFKKFDRTGNLDEAYAKNRLKSGIDKLDPDELVQMLGYRKSRSELMREEDELESYGRNRFANAEGYNLDARFGEMRRKKGFDNAHNRIAELGRIYKELLTNKNLGLLNPNQFKIREEELLKEISEGHAKIKTKKTLKEITDNILSEANEVKRKPGRPPKNKELVKKIDELDSEIDEDNEKDGHDS